MDSSSMSSMCVAVSSANPCCTVGQVSRSNGGWLAVDVDVDVGTTHLACVRRLAAPAVILAIIYVYLCVVFICLQPQVYVDTTKSVQWMGINVLAGVLVVQYVRCWWSDPGTVQTGWLKHVTSETDGSGPSFRVQTEAGPMSVSPRQEHPCESWPVEVEPLQRETNVRLRGGEEILLPCRVRECSRCMVFRPARAHHCRWCNRCVLKLDHHCFFVNNCIGFGNYQFFLGFLVFLLVDASIAAYMVMGALFQTGQHLPPRITGLWDLLRRLPLSTHLLLWCLPLLSVALSLSILQLSRHVPLVLRDATSVEHRRQLDLAGEARDAGVALSVRSAYDAGWRANLLKVCGSPLTWALGIRHARREPGHEWAGYAWRVPPRVQEAWLADREAVDRAVRGKLNLRIQ